MAELFGAIQRGLGTTLNAIYEVTNSYALAIILLTIAVRALMIPLTVKQIRSMSAMQKLAPEQKKIQQKYKQLQQKAKDRMEVQQLRLQMNQELQGLFRQHGVNPLGGCFPLLAQMPVFIAMFSIMRASIFAIPMAVSPVGGASIAELPTGRDASAVICRPVDDAGSRVEPRADGPTPSRIDCEGPNGRDYGEFTISDLREGRGGQGQQLTNAGWIAFCNPTGDQSRPFICTSSNSVGHLPRDGELFADVTRDKATIFGMHAGCSAQQAGSSDRIRQCTSTRDDASGATSVPYYLLIALIVATSWYQSKQMAARATGPTAAQQQMLTRIMPVMFGFISLSIPAGANLYFLATNAWTIGQQHILLKRQDAMAAAAKDENGKPAKEGKGARQATAVEEPPAKAPAQPPRPQGSKKKKRKKKR